MIEISSSRLNIFNPEIEKHEAAILQCEHEVCQSLVSDLADQYTPKLVRLKHVLEYLEHPTHELSVPRFKHTQKFFPENIVGKAMNTVALTLNYSLDTSFPVFHEDIVRLERSSDKNINYVPAVYYSCLTMLTDSSLPAGMETTAAWKNNTTSRFYLLFTTDVPRKINDVNKIIFNSRLKAINNSWCAQLDENLDKFTLHGPLGSRLIFEHFDSPVIHNTQMFVYVYEQNHILLGNNNGTKAPTLEAAQHILSPSST